MWVPPVSVWVPRILGPSCLSVTVSTSQSLYPWPAAVTIKTLGSGYSGCALGSQLLPGGEVGVTREPLAAWGGGGRTVQNSDLPSRWVLLEPEALRVQSGSAFAVFLFGFLLRIGMIRNS